MAPDTISAHDVSVKILRRFRAEHTPQDFQKNRAVCRLAFGFSGPPCFNHCFNESFFTVTIITYYNHFCCYHRWRECHGCHGWHLYEIGGLCSSSRINELSGSLSQGEVAPGYPLMLKPLVGARRIEVPKMS